MQLDGHSGTSSQRIFMGPQHIESWVHSASRIAFTELVDFALYADDDDSLEEEEEEEEEEEQDEDEEESDDDDDDADDVPISKRFSNLQIWCGACSINKQMYQWMDHECTFA